MVAVQPSPSLGRGGEGMGTVHSSIANGSLDISDEYTK